MLSPPPILLFAGCEEGIRARSLRGRNDRREKAGNRDQIFSILSRIVVLFVEESRKYGPILPFSQ